ncbi:hypothetical protein HYV98_00330 [Candidatus Azambacteria bacterium]|nr:hypothetical protein [Candidatus Azambacteria bacterium]
MIIEIVPTVLVKDFEEVKRRIKLVEPYVKWIQIDVIDGRYAPMRTWNEPGRLKEISTSASLEADLMLQNPSDEVLEAWINSGVKRVFVAWEGVDDVERLWSIIKKGPSPFDKLRAYSSGEKIEVGISIAPDTPISVLEPFIPQLDAVMIRTAVPGAPGRPFEPRTLEKIRQFHAAHPGVPIAVDGGVNAQTVGEIAKAGATLVGAGTFIFEHSEGVMRAIEELNEAATI